MSSHLRDARFSDYWRTLYKKNFPLKINNISVNSANIFHNLDLSFNGSLNVIIGKNGVGKTNFLRNIFNALNSEGESNRANFDSLLDKNDIFLKYKINDLEKNYKFSYQGAEDQSEDILSFIFDPCYLIPDLVSLIRTQQNFNEIFEGVNGLDYSSDKLDEINYITNNLYKKISVFNIEDEYPNFPIFPIFIVERDGLQYDSRSMGLGELSMLYLFWMLDYISKDSKNILLIIEEPESFISPLVQSRLINILVKYIVDKNLNCIISTHSEHILKKIPATSLKQLIYSPRKNEYKFIELKNLEILQTLGLSIPKKGILFFEDRAAELFLKQLINQSHLNAVENFYFHCSGDDSHIVSHLNEMPKALNNFQFIGVFDGDARKKVPRLLKDGTKSIFLPTEMAPEQIIMEYIDACDLESIDEYLHISIGSFDKAYQLVTGADHHEIFRNIANILGYDFDYLFTELCKMWIKDETSESQVSQFIIQFDAFFK